MMTEVAQKDVIFLVADTNMEHVIKGVLSRPESLGIRQVTNEIYVHPERDPGCRLRSHEFLRPFVNRFAHALVLFDLEGCGSEDSRSALEQGVQNLLAHNGWDDRAEVIVLNPELEIWVWTSSPWVERILGWEGRQPDLKTWLKHQGLWPDGSLKPKQPKAAMEQALRAVRQPRSSSLYHKLAENVKMTACIDPAFGKLRTLLIDWFRQET